MSLISDVSELVFRTSGVSKVLSDYQKMENEAIKLERLQENAYYAKAGPQRDKAQQALQDFSRLQRQAAEREAAEAKNKVLMDAKQGVLAAAAAAAAVIGTEIKMVREAIGVYTEYGREIQAVRAMTGGSIRDSEQFVNLARVAGLDARGMSKEIAHLVEATQSGEGRSALMQLGVAVVPGENGLALFDKIRQALAGIQDGTRKTALEMKIFGAKGIEGFLPWLNMSQDIYERTKALDSEMSGPALAAITHFQQSGALLGQTILVDLVYPLAEKLLPTFDWVINKIQEAVTWFHELDSQFHGALTYAAIFTGIALAITSVVNVIRAASVAMKALVAIEWLQNAALAVRDALMGPAGWAALAVAGVVTVGAAASAWNAGNAGGQTGTDIKEGANTFKNAVSDFGNAVVNFKSWSSAAGGQIGSGFTEGDYAHLIAMNARGAVG